MNITTAQRRRTSIHGLSTVLCLTLTSKTEKGNETTKTNEAVLRELNYQSVRQLAPVIGYLVLLMVIGILGNSVTCYIYKQKMKKTTTNRFILWLAALDLIACGMGMPFDIYDVLLEYLFDQSIICKIFRFAMCWTFSTSFITMVSIAIDRRYKICKPLKQSPTRKYHYFIVGSAIIGSIVASPIFVFYGTSEKKTSCPGIVGHACTIKQGFKNSTLTVSYFGFLLLCNVLGMVCLSILYICIWFEVWKRSRRTMEEKGRSKTTDMKNGRKNKGHRVTIQCIAITIAFGITFFPTLILHILRAAKTGFEEELSDSSFVAYSFFIYSYFLSNVINPVLYGFLNPIFRRECVLLLKRWDPFRKCRSDSNTSVQEVNCPSGLSKNESLSGQS